MQNSAQRRGYRRSLPPLCWVANLIDPDFFASEQNSHTEVNVSPLLRVPGNRESPQTPVFDRKQQIGARPVNEIQEGTAISRQRGIKVTLGREWEKAQISCKRTVLAKSPVPFELLSLTEF